MKIFLISGKARTGKTTTAHMIRDYYKPIEKRTIITSFSKYIKMYAREITDWDGSEEDKPRRLLQALGNMIRDTSREDFFVNRIDEDLSLYKMFSDTVAIDDARLPLEIDHFKEKYPRDTIAIRIERPNNQELPPEEQGDITELGLDNYPKYDYTIINDGTLEDLREKVYAILERL